LKAGVSTFAIGALLLLILSVFLGRENKKSDSEVMIPVAKNEKDQAEAACDEDLTDRENRTFKYVL
jgi:hypothetical protein